MAKKYELLAKSSPDIIYEMEIESERFIFANPSIEKILGYTPEEAMNLTAKEILTSESYILQRDSFIEDMNTGKETTRMLELDAIHKDGHIVFFEVNAAFVTNEKGNICSVVGVARDITERKKLQKAFYESEERYRRLTEMSPDINYIIGKDLKVQYVNAMGLKLMGMQSSEILGERLEKFFPPDIAKSQIKNLIQVFENGQSQYAEGLSNLDGSPVWLGTWLIPIKNANDDETESIIGISRIITDQKKNEERIAALLKEKEFLLKEVHHRIKNNMNIMNSLLSLQANKEKDPSVVTALKDVQNRFQAMGVLYERLFQTENLNEMSVKDYIPQFLNAVINPFSGMSNVKIVANVDDFMLGVKELSTLGIIINELITNSMKYAFVGKSDGLITVKASKKNDHAIFCIEDNGIGLPESINIKNSTGFGLMLVNALTEQLKGTIRIERKKGTKFIIEFEIS